MAALPEVGSRAAAERLLERGAILVDGALRPKSHRLVAASEIEIVLDAGPAEPVGPLPEVRVVVADEHLLVVDKPARLVVHPGAGRARGTLVDVLRPYGLTPGDEPDRPGIVHRLDRDTSGLLVVARTEAAYRGLQRLVRERGIERRYLALVRGRPASRTGKIDAPVGRDRLDPTRISLDTGTPREAVTWFETVETTRLHALLDVGLETGRTHQIRVHLAAVGLPVSGDPVYGIPNDLGLARQFLHAARLAFLHPVTREPVEAESPLPADLSAALDRARAE